MGAMDEAIAKKEKFAKDTGMEASCLLVSRAFLKRLTFEITGLGNGFVVDKCLGLDIVLVHTPVECEFVACGRKL